MTVIYNRTNHLRHVYKKIAILGGMAIQSMYSV